ncbi:DUF3160 domain-containing protein [candidate division KSB1 bacterium]|nr:DUF3160 domain-containing protein [candidate division KSB1 bacterium]
MKIISYIVLTIIILILLPISLQGQGMIATITQPVETEFGIYTPIAVDITPACNPYVVNDNFSNVINYHDFTFTAAEESLLSQYEFVVSPRRLEGGTGYREIYDVYNECRDMNIPIFVTTDAVLHTFHLCFDYILMTMEKRKFVPDLNTLLTEMIMTTHDYHANATDGSVLTALKRNLDFLITAKKLLDPCYSPPTYDNPLYDEEIALIMNAVGFIESPIYEYLEDYSQYLPRGHYTKSDSLKQYFRSMMWLGRMIFSADPSCGLDEPNRTMTRSAILLIHALGSVATPQGFGLDLWENIYAPTVFFVGKSDDINFYQYIPIMELVYGSDYQILSPDHFADDDELDVFLTHALQLQGPKIAYPFQTQGFRFMGQRFIPDSYVFSELTYDRIPDTRYFPYGLDAMVVLGSALSEVLLGETGDMDAYPSYPPKLAALKSEFATYAENQWAENIYWNWLYSLMPLLFQKTEGYPNFMRNPAWAYKELAAALSSWAELRHDTILYAKQSGSWTGITPNAIMQQGYVEPNPHLYARLASLADYLIEGLRGYELLYDDFESRMIKLHDLLVRLKTISEKELTNTSLSPEDYATITEFGAIIEDIVQFESDYGNMGPGFDAEDNMPVIADVHTVGGTGPTMFLEEGVGYPLCIYVISPVEGQLKITKGACFSYYEFVKVGEPRLTDEAWRDMLTSDEPPLHPWWTGRYAAIEQALINDRPEFHHWSTFDTYTLDVQVTPDEPEIGDTITVSVSTIAGHWYELSIPHLKVTLADGNILNIDDFARAEEHYETKFSSQHLPEGQMWLQIDAKFVDFFESPISFRTGFYLENSTNVPFEKPSAVPARLFLAQNYPNPFNSSSIIHYYLPQPAKVELTIYSVTGALVRVLENSHRTSGEHTTLWDGMDKEGAKAASGVYILTLRVGDIRLSRRMVLLY